MKLAVLGLDGLFPECIDAFADALPALARIRREGFAAPLRSTMPPYTPQAWTTMVTGVNPGRHGIAGFTRRTGGREELLDRTCIRARQLWDYLAAGEVSTGLLNVPLSYPAPQVPGFAIAGMLCPSPAAPGFAWPPPLAAELLDRVPDYAIDIAVKKKDFHDPRAAARLCAVLRARIRAARFLLETRPVDVFFCVLVALDRAFHLWFRYLDPRDPLSATGAAAEIRRALLPAFGEIDAFAAELAGRAEHLLVVSDHGFRREEGKFYANRFLADHGLAVLRPSLRRTLSDVAIRLLGRDRLRRLLPKALIEREIEAAAPAPNGRAFAAPLAAQGIFAADEDARAEVVRLLRDLRDPRSGAPLATALLAREELYAGPECARFPHVVIELAGGGIEVSPHLLGRECLHFAPEDWPGGHHDRRGVWIARGPGIAPRDAHEPLGIEDVLPTALALLGLPVPEGLDGRPAPVRGEA
ncbi:MAG TPA: hypothetical protein DCM87_16270 [Planctomycetes bacterium]|nr:hypothetical protein [Planctomycetota bacterium]